MTGFIRGLFGGNNGAQPPTPEEKEAFYLQPDDAKSFGNIEYMRSNKVVRRTFARKQGVTGELESIRQVSALESVRLRKDGTPIAPLNSQVNGAAQQEPSPASRRSVDTSLDMFRSMAKEMKK